MAGIGLNKGKKTATITLKRVAEEAGYSLAAVSTVLNNSKSNAGVSPDGRKKILEVARSLGYQRNLSAAYLARGRTKCIGVVLDYLDYFPYNHYFTLINEACLEAGYHAVPFPIKRKAITEGAAHWGEVHVDGVIVLDYVPHGDLDEFQKSMPQSPFVCRITDPLIRPPAVPSILIDYYDGTRMLLKHVFDMGWKKIQIVTEDDPNRPFSRHDGQLLEPYQVRAIQDEFSDRGITTKVEDTLIRFPGRRARVRYEGMMKYLADHKLEPGVCLLQDGADGISGTYAALEKSGYVIGRDVAVASLQAIPGWEHVEPHATFLWERFEELSRLLVHLAVDTIEGGKNYSRTAQFRYPASLFKGQSLPVCRV